MNLSDFHYELPSSAIAQEPMEPRDHSRLLVVDRSSPKLTDNHFYDIVDYLRRGDILVTNATKVFPARLRGRKATGGKIEVLLLEARSADATIWRGLVRGSTRPAPLVFAEELHATMDERLTEGEWLLRFSRTGIRSYLDVHGEMPLPPYIKRTAPRASDLERYQTVYAENEGAVAAPTAGFHLTPALLDKIRGKGVSVQSIVLHVGWGTFRPVRTETIEEHAMLPESYEVPDAVACELNRVRAEGGRVIAVGTTAVRTLETICDAEGTFHAGHGQTNLFIYPGYRFRGVDALITNFHLPDSTPLLLANAFYAQQGDSSAKNFPFALKEAYLEAIRLGYRFYSYGDAMFIQ